MFQRRVLVSVVASLLALVLAQSALAAITSNTIDPVTTMSKNGRHAAVSGPVACEAGERIRIRVTVDQASTGAHGQGISQAWCTGDVQQWSVQVHARGRAAFDEGSAEACAFATTRYRGTITDTQQWCAANGITLVGTE